MSLKQAVGIMGSAQLGTKLTDAEEDAIVAFLHTLTGQQPKSNTRSCPSEQMQRQSPY